MSKLEKLQGGNKYKLGITFGAWDLFHVGHLMLLVRARFLCDKLIVGVSTDEYIEKIKKQEPIISYGDRRAIIQGLSCVENAIPQDLDENTKRNVVIKYRPDVIFVGNDWKGKDWEGAKLGVPVVYLPYTKRISSTKIYEKILNSCTKRGYKVV